MKKIPVGVLGATGTVGQRFIQLLDEHPWFKLTALAASDNSAGRSYAEACHWLLSTPIPPAVRDEVVQPVEANLDCALVFSALPSAVAAPVEKRFAEAGYAVCSNTAAHRMEPDVPLLIPEVNADHTALIDVQQRRRAWRGFIVTNPNCSTTQLAIVLKPLHEAFALKRLSVTTLQAISGAGFPGVASLDILGNVIPFIDGEEEKMEREPQKLLGALRPGQIEPASFVLSAQCNRVAVRDGHTECVNVGFEHSPALDELIAALAEYNAAEEIRRLPSSPHPLIVVHRSADRPQPVLDRDAGKGMAVNVGRIRTCPLLDYKFVILGHNTFRGAAAGAIHNAELLVQQGWVK